MTSGSVFSKNSPRALIRIAHLSFAFVQSRALTFALVIVSCTFANRTGLVLWTCVLLPWRKVRGKEVTSGLVELGMSVRWSCLFSWKEHKHEEEGTLKE
jgi:hypothetical protein